jgi:hypothetical protein
MNEMGKQAGYADEVSPAINVRDTSHDENDLEIAWLWFAGQAMSDEARRYCFERALLANPASMAARHGLESLQPKPAAHQSSALNLGQLFQTGVRSAITVVNSLRQRNSSFIVE